MLLRQGTVVMKAGRWVRFLVVVGLSAASCEDGRSLPLGSESMPEGIGASALRQRFPERAALVLEQGDTFIATREGFARAASRGRGAWRGVDIALPRDGRETIRMRGFGGIDVRVRELGASGEGVMAGRAVAYPRAGGTSFWTAGSGGVVEEWLHLEASAVHAGEPVATWEVEGATVRQRGEGVEVVDAGGIVRLSVTAPKAYAAEGRDVGARLVGNGERIELRVDTDEEALLVDPKWAPGSTMHTGRYDHTATRLGSGKVLVVGGSGDTSVDLYDPVANSWSSVASASVARKSHTATLLTSGKVLVAGGEDFKNNFAISASAELYDPATNTWSSAGSMSHGRTGHTATLLGNGKVLIAGGGDMSSFLQTTELYDPATNTWSPAGPLTQKRALHTATLLGNGKVLIAGGEDGVVDPPSAELYDPMTNTCWPCASMSQTRWAHTATLLGSGKVLVAGGYTNASAELSSAELYDPTANTWSSAGMMSATRSDHAATLLGSGEVLVAGGWQNGSFSAGTEVYDPVKNAWSPAGQMGYTRVEPTATLVGIDEVLVAGGLDSNWEALQTTELYLASLPLGSACALEGDCKSGFCADGVCCDIPCNAGPCDVCSVAAGAASDGTCALLTGPSCDDGNPCTQSDTCQAGLCVGVNLMGSACDDGNACTQTDTCQAGVCTGANPVVCSPHDQCHDAGVCNPATGVCSNPPKKDGAACTNGTCQGGVCITGSSTSSSSGTSSSGKTSTSSGGSSASSSSGTSSSGKTSTSSGESSTSSSSITSSSGTTSSGGSGGAGGRPATTSTSATSSSSGGAPEILPGCACVPGSRSDNRGAPGGVAFLALALASRRPAGWRARRRRRAP